MARRIVDLSIYLENDVISDPPPYRPRIDYIDHTASVPELIGFFPGLRQEDLPDGEAWAIERIELLPRENPWCLSGLDSRRRHPRSMSFPIIPAMRILALRSQKKGMFHA